jgi:hypothetical protein
MSETATLLVISDIHYASAAEQQRSEPEMAAIAQPVLRMTTKAFRYFIWMRHPYAHNHMLDRFMDQAGDPDCVIGNGDFSCDSAFVGLCDDAAYASAWECLGKLRDRFKGRFQANFGDHELGKMSLFGRQGGLRLASLRRAQNELGMQPFWQIVLGNQVLIGVVSSLLALPVFEPETLPAERAEWRRIREAHLVAIRGAFAGLRREQRVWLFCHDPTALPWLWHEEAVRHRLDQLEATFIGHLHSHLILWKSRMLAGMPTIRFLGNSVRRMSAALNEARHWRSFKVRLCPALAGIELFKRGGYYRVTLDLAAQRPARIQLIALPR